MDNNSFSAMTKDELIELDAGSIWPAAVAMGTLLVAVAVGAFQAGRQFARDFLI